MCDMVELRSAQPILGQNAFHQYQQNIGNYAGAILGHIDQDYSDQVIGLPDGLNSGLSNYSYLNYLPPGLNITDRYRYQTNKVSHWVYHPRGSDNIWSWGERHPINGDPNDEFHNSTFKIAIPVGRNIP